MTPATDFVETRVPAATASGRALPVGFRLRDYEITGCFGEGATSIVYAAWDHSLQRKVAVKEYMPIALVARVSGSPVVAANSERFLDPFEAGLRGFVNESRLLARFDHPSLAKVYRFWEENGTAYMVMPCLEGPTLATALAELGHVPSESELRTWLRPVLNAISVLHEGGTWHQNIAPDEILLTPVGPVLLGFASAAHAIEEARHTPAAALKPGFAAIEQYGSTAGTTRGPWTDLYGLAAVIYAAITGSEPVAAADRLVKDPVHPLAIIAAGLYSDAFLAAVDAAMRVRPESRPRDHLEFRALMGDIDAPEAPVSLAPRRDLMQEPFIGGRADDREVTVPDRPLLAPSETTLPPASDAPVARPRPTAPGALRDSGTMPLATQRKAASWTGGVRGEGAFGKRALYGVVAVTCFLVGAVALVIQFYMRQATTGAPVAATTSGAAAVMPGGMSAATTLPVPVPAIVGPAVTTTALPLPPPAAPPTPPSTRPDLGRATPQTTPQATPTATTPVTPATPPAVAGTNAAPIAAPAAATPVAGSTERQARCIEILQKASLEPISAAETEFFKKECR